MNSRELSTLNSLVTYAAENIPGGLNSDEKAVARLVGMWVMDGVHIRPVCPFCQEAIQEGESRYDWLKKHMSAAHRAWCAIRPRKKR